jgi:hypothetical protein
LGIRRCGDEGNDHAEYAVYGPSPRERHTDRARQSRRERWQAVNPVHQGLTNGSLLRSRRNADWFGKPHEGVI